MELKSKVFKDCMEDESWSDSELICLATEMLESYEEEIKSLNAKLKEKHKC